MTMTTTTTTVDPPTDRLLVQIASYNTNLQALRGLPQDLVDWLAPTLHVSSFLTKRRAPDIVAVGFQELLPLHHGLAGFSNSVIEDRNKLILSQIEAHAPNKESYNLIAKVVNVGVALLVYGRDDGLARCVSEVESAWSGCGPGFMGNKGAVGVRFRLRPSEDDVGETLTFVNCHLTAHQHKLKQRIADYEHIVSTLAFSPISPDSTSSSSTIYETSHLFVLGDLNFRLDIPPSHPLAGREDFAHAIESEKTRADLKEFDQLTMERKKGTVFIGLREGEFWKFKCSYKYHLGEVDEYSMARTPSWTDRILYATYTDSPHDPDKSNINNLLYTSIPSYTTSDHKPIVALLELPPRPSQTPPAPTPLLSLPATFTPTVHPYAGLQRLAGHVLGRIVGIVWWLLTLIGAGSGVVGIFNCFVGIGALTWWRAQPSPPNGSV